MRGKRIAALGFGAALFGATAAWAGEGPPQSPAATPDVAGAAPNGTAGLKESSADALDALFLKLRQAEGPEAARPIEAAVIGLLSESDSPSIDLIMKRGGALLRESDLSGSLYLYSIVTMLRPRFAAGWRQRGIVRALHGDAVRAADDLRRAIAIEPRDIAALASLGRLLEKSGKDADALDIYRRALALDPHVPEVGERAKRLETELRGQPL